MPAGALVTVPVPTAVTVSAYSAVKEGVTLAEAFSVILHALVPVQLPLHPLKT
jgi:hypothetical protein